MIICKSKFTLAFKKEGAFKVTVKQLRVALHATVNATFALSGQQNLLEIKRLNYVFINCQECAPVSLTEITRSIFQVM